MLEGIIIGNKLFIFSRGLMKITGKAAPTIFKVMWLTVTPILVIVIMFFSIIGYSKLTYGDYVVSLIESLFCTKGPFFAWTPFLQDFRQFLGAKNVRPLYSLQNFLFNQIQYFVISILTEF